MMGGCAQSPRVMPATLLHWDNSIASWFPAAEQPATVDTTARLRMLVLTSASTDLQPLMVQLSLPLLPLPKEMNFLVLRGLLFPHSRLGLWEAER